MIIGLSLSSSCALSEADIRHSMSMTDCVTEIIPAAVLGALSNMRVFIVPSSYFSHQSLSFDFENFLSAACESISPIRADRDIKGAGFLFLRRLRHALQQALLIYDPSCRPFPEGLLGVSHVFVGNENPA